MSLIFSPYKHSLIILILLSILFTLSFSLSKTHSHAQSKPIQQREYSQLINQQKSLQTNINSLLDNMLSVQKNVSSSLKSSDKVLTLQKAIISQRQTIFNIQSSIIQPFSLSKTACLQLSNQQKIDLLDRINVTRQQLFTLQKKILETPKCDKITALQNDAQKQLTLLDTLQKTILTGCQTKSILTPTIYQTNIYADGWILGDQHIDDLIEQYYQRNIRYHNITNCPLDRPFFNGQQCVKCQSKQPVFNILTRQCTTCPQDQQPDPSIRQCSYLPHYTDFKLLNNWAQEGASMPVYTKNQIPCSLTKPYYDGKKCQPCLLPKYWSIKKNACVQCPKQTLFDVNSKKCQIPQTWDLTLLQRTRWVTNDCNVTRIVKQRFDILQINQTKKYYKYCPADRPYYDGLVCVNCPNEFNVDTRLCVATQNKTAAYNQNMRCYLNKENNVQTDPRALNYTSKTALNDSPVPNCKFTKPYYDGISCIQCLQPFSIFNVQTRRCSNCDSMQYYNKTLHKCITRQKVYISTNQNKLMATSNMSLLAYQDQIRKKVTSNPEAVILICNSSTQYSDYKQCFDCKSDEYYNVQTKKCGICDGSLNITSKVCLQKAYLYTNFNNDSLKRIVNMTNTVQKQNKTINDNILLHPNSKLCPLTAPYSTKKGCTNCTKQSFDYKLFDCVPTQCNDPALPFYNTNLDKCTPCPSGMVYDANNTKQCILFTYFTNLNALYFYIQDGNYTKDNLKLQRDKLASNKSLKIIDCDPSHPYYNGLKCIDCPINTNLQDAANHKPFFNLRTKICQACKQWDDKIHKCNDVILSPQNCTNGQVFDNNALTCLKLVSNINQLSQMPNKLIQNGNGTLQNLKSIAQSVSNPLICPKQTPLYSQSSKKCISCVDPNPYYNLLKLVCESCTNYDQVNKSCAGQLPRFDMSLPDYYSNIAGSIF